MDKNTITGLVLIAILLVGFSFLSRPSQEQLEAQQRYYDSIAQVQQREADLKAKAEAALANESGAEASVDSTALFFDARQGTNSQVTIQNNRRYKRRAHSFGHAEGIHGTRQDDPRHTVQRQ